MIFGITSLNFSRTSGYKVLFHYEDMYLAQLLTILLEPWRAWWEYLGRSSVKRGILDRESKCHEKG